MDVEIPTQYDFYKSMFKKGFKLYWVTLPGLGLSYFVNTPDGYAIVPSPREPMKRYIEDIDHFCEGWIGYQKPSTNFDDIYGSYCQTHMYERFVDYLKGLKTLPEWITE